MTDPRHPVLGDPNAPCRSCAAPLAADQRYCLQCGDRRAEARLPFLEILAGRTAAPAGVVAETAVAGARRSPAALVARLGANTVAVAGVACLLLALGVGVLIGKGRDGSSATAGPPQVISVGGVAPAAAPSTATPAATAPPPAAPTKAKAHKKAGASAPAHQTKATNKALQDLNSTSAQDYQKKSAKLPKQLGTGGKAPPKDNKKAAGGGSFTEIG